MRLNRFVLCEAILRDTPQEALQDNNVLTAKVFLHSSPVPGVCSAAHSDHACANVIDAECTTCGNALLCVEGSSSRDIALRTYRYSNGRQRDPTSAGVRGEALRRGGGTRYTARRRQGRWKAVIGAQVPPLLTPASSRAFGGAWSAFTARPAYLTRSISVYRSP